MDWFRERYEDLMFDEHKKGHPESDSSKCPYCPQEEVK